MCFLWVLDVIYSLPVRCASMSLGSRSQAEFLPLAAQRPMHGLLADAGVGRDQPHSTSPCQPAVLGCAAVTEADVLCNFLNSGCQQQLPGPLHVGFRDTTQRPTCSPIQLPFLPPAPPAARGAHYSLHPLLMEMHRVAALL